jgi:hypothetical protein
MWIELKGDRKKKGGRERERVKGGGWGGWRIMILSSSCLNPI